MNKLQRRMFLGSMITVYVGVTFIAWLAWSMVKTVECTNWQSKPLDQVPAKCVKEAK